MCRGECADPLLAPTASALREVLTDFLTRSIPHRRVARLAGLLLLAGRVDDTLLSDVVGYVASRQQQDGGWVDCEDTSWCALVLRSLPAGSEGSVRGSVWLRGERAGPAWGYCRRDSPCIPITATVRILLPHLRDEASARWLRTQWDQDISGPVQLSYKGAWYLLARDKGPADESLAVRTRKHLVADQREDGGWGPWRGHPAPTDCFTTGLVMWALAQDRFDQAHRECILRAVRWCERTRLPNGLFPTHYIEEGTAWLLLGWSAALARLSETAA